LWLGGFLSECSLRFILTETILYGSFNEVVRICSLRAAIDQLRFRGAESLGSLNVGVSIGKKRVKNRT
jgi:hypothetical protein